MSAGQRSSEGETGAGEPDSSVAPWQAALALGRSPKSLPFGPLHRLLKGLQDVAAASPE